jgi:hypothetical protein
MKQALIALFKPIAANESNLTMWIFIAVIAIAAVAGIVYFIIQNKRKK